MPFRGVFLVAASDYLLPKFKNNFKSKISKYPDENDPEHGEHLAQSNKATLRPSGRIVLPDYFDVILKGVGLLRNQRNSLTLTYVYSVAFPSSEDRTTWSQQFISAVGKILDGPLDTEQCA